MLAQINEKKERARSAIYQNTQKHLRSQSRNLSLNQSSSQLKGQTKSKQYLDKVRKQAELEDEDSKKAFNFHRVLKSELET